MAPIGEDPLGRRPGDRKLSMGGGGETDRCVHVCDVEPVKPVAHPGELLQVRPGAVDVVHGQVRPQPGQQGEDKRRRVAVRPGDHQ